MLTVNTHTVCVLSTRDDRRITYTHPHTHTYKDCATPVPDVIPWGRKVNTHLAYTHTDTLTGQGASAWLQIKTKTSWVCLTRKGVDTFTQEPVIILASLYMC